MQLRDGPDSSPPCTSRAGSLTESAYNDSEDTSSHGSDDIGMEVPYSSSPVSSPRILTPPESGSESTLKLNRAKSKVQISSEILGSGMYAHHIGGDNSSRLSEELEKELRIVSALYCPGESSLASSSHSSHSDIPGKAENGTVTPIMDTPYDRASRDSEADDFSYEEDDEKTDDYDELDEETYVYPLDRPSLETRASQVAFSEQLDTLLLRVLKEQKDTPSSNVSSLSDCLTAKSRDIGAPFPDALLATSACISTSCSPHNHRVTGICHTFSSNTFKNTSSDSAISSDNSTSSSSSVADSITQVLTCLQSDTIMQDDNGHHSSSALEMHSDPVSFSPEHDNASLDPCFATGYSSLGTGNILHAQRFLPDSSSHPSSVELKDEAHDTAKDIANPGSKSYSAVPPSALHPSLLFRSSSMRTSLNLHRSPFSTPTLATKFPARDIHAPPPAPKKVQRHVHLPLPQLNSRTQTQAVSHIQNSVPILGKRALLSRSGSISGTTSATRSSRRSDQDETANSHSIESPKQPGYAYTHMDTGLLPPENLKLEDEVAPIVKRRKMSSSRSLLSFTLDKGRYASKPASLRKAASLRSEASIEDALSASQVPVIEKDAKVKTEPSSTDPFLRSPRFSPRRLESHIQASSATPLIPHLSCHVSQDGTSTATHEYPPTEPATPVVTHRTTGQLRLSYPNPPSVRHSQSPLSPTPPVCSRSPPVPIIAPPPYVLIPSAPISKEDAASSRISLMIEKEMTERGEDVLDTISDTDEGEADSEQDEEMDTDEAQMWREVGASMSDVVEEGSQGEETNQNGQHQTQVTTPGDDEEFGVIMCIDEELRQEVVEWILNVLPPSFPSKPNVCHHLRDQLNISPDTRWHAAQMFMRYCIKIGDPEFVLDSEAPSTVEEGKGAEQGGGYRRKSARLSAEDGRVIVAWDVAMACLTLAVKFHRDVLDPLFPVLADEFLLLAPHDMSYEDLETSQRDVFHALSFKLGSITPGSYMQEFWIALPSLRLLLEFKGGWDVVKRDTWELLSDALYEIDHLRFPPYLLTSCALVHTIINTLILKSKIDFAVTISTRLNKWRSRRYGTCECVKLRKNASKAAKHVEMDMRDLIGVDSVLWNKCMKWLGVMLDVQC